MIRWMLGGPLNLKDLDCVTYLSVKMEISRSQIIYEVEIPEHLLTVFEMSNPSIILFPNLLVLCTKLSDRKLSALKTLNARIDGTICEALRSIRNAHGLSLEINSK